MKLANEEIKTLKFGSLSMGECRGLYVEGKKSRVSVD